MLEVLSGPAGLVAVLIVWVVLQAVVLPRLGVGT